jgi:hypothetical protein
LLCSELAKPNAFVIAAKTKLQPSLPGSLEYVAIQYWLLASRRALQLLSDRVACDFTTDNPAFS